jgi:hypothetical protein
VECVRGEEAGDGAGAVGYAEGGGLGLSQMSVSRTGVWEEERRTLSELESPEPNVLCVLHAALAQSCAMTHVLLAAESRSRWYSSLLDPMVTATM